jgi:glycosyltransferase involved in cell wall biosynthesis
MTPKVTVLLAVRDGEPYVQAAVASILEQTFTDFEFLVVDDASSDRTAEIVESFADPRIRLLRNHRNVGQVPSLNRGLREARGEYVARIDADDISLPRRLERQTALLDAQPSVGLVGAWMNVVDERGRSVTRLDARIDDKVRFVFETLTMHVLIAHPAAAYRRKPVLELGGYDERTGPAEDKDLWRRLLLAGWDARIVAEPLVVYRLHDAQLSQTQAAYQREVDGRSQEWFLEELARGAPVRRVRLLLAGDTAFWSRREEHLPETLRSLDGVLAGARQRLLDDSERAADRLDSLVAEHVLRVARARPWSGDARALHAWALSRLAAEQRSGAITRNAAALVLAPPARAVRFAARSGSRAADRVPPLRSLRAPVKRSRVARRLFAKLVGGG